jgi:hypothetical protein
LIHSLFRKTSFAFVFSFPRIHFIFLAISLAISLASWRAAVSRAAIHVSGVMNEPRCFSGLLPARFACGRNDAGGGGEREAC